MMKGVNLMKVQLRTERGSITRESGLVPGIFYGKDIESTKIQVNPRDLRTTYDKMGNTKSFEIELDGKKHFVLIRDIQFDVFKQNQMIHFDLLKVSEDDIVTANIPIRLVGREEFEANSGLILQLVADELGFDFPANKGVSYIEVDVSSLKEGDTITAADVVVPEGYVLRDEPTKAVVTVTTPTIAEESEGDSDDVAVEEDTEE